MILPLPPIIQTARFLILHQWGTNELLVIYFINYILQLTLGFPGASVSKESAYNAGDLGSIPGSGISPGEGNDYPLQYSSLENSMDRGTWRATVYEVLKEVNMTERLSTRPYFTVHSVSCSFMRLDKCVTSCIQQYRIVQSSFPCVSSILSLSCESLPPSTSQHVPFYCLYRFASFSMSCHQNYTVCSLFRLSSLTVYIYGSFMSYSLIAHIFLELKNVVCLGFDP